MKIYGLEKLSLVDYENHMCCIVFTGKCNFRCCFCHNISLVTTDLPAEIPMSDFFNYLKLRKGLIDAVCVSGGEPTIQADLPEFLKQIKDLGYLIKLDTNGTNYTMLKNLIDAKLVDYVAMDIKNSKQMYNITVGVDIDLSNILKSVELLKTDVVDYEFRTTLVNGLHTLESIKQMSEWLKGSKKMYLQKFKDTGTCIKSNLKEVPLELAKEFQITLSSKIKCVSLRGYE